MRKLDSDIIEITQDNCPVCESAFTTLKNYESNHLVKCDNCGFVFSSKIPSRIDLEQYYQSDYDRTSYFSAITKKRYDELLDQFESYRSTNKILDLGCGYGYFLDVAKARGWEVYGVEIAKEAADICRSKGITMYHGVIENCAFEVESFDVVISIEVIEHLSNPNIILDSAQRMLREGGLFYVTTPNFNSYLRYQLKGKYDVIDYPNHLSYFTKKTLEEIFKKNHFQKLSIKTTGISLTRLKTSKKVSNQEFVSETSDDEMFRYRIEKNGFLRFLKSMTNRGLNLFGLGVTLKGSFIKR